MRRLARQIDSRNQLLDETEKQARLLRGRSPARTAWPETFRQSSNATAQYGEMVREAYRNYKHNNYLTYIFSSRDFTDVARKSPPCARSPRCANANCATSGADRRGPHRKGRSTAASGRSTR